MDRKLPTGKEKKRYVTRMFTGLSGNYDLVNSICSLFIDHAWRLRAVKSLAACAEGRVLDLCAGTLPLSLALLKRTRGKIVAVDISEGMLRKGFSRIAAKPAGTRFAATCGDGEFLPLLNETCDGAMVAFGIRNLSDMDKGFLELARVIRPGGKLVILEFSRPKHPLFACLYRLYLRLVLVPVGTLLTGDRDAYQYLVSSIEAFPRPEQITLKLRKAGFTNTEYIPLTMGIVNLYKAERV